MKLWISKNGEVSVREQIVTQIRLGIATRDLVPGEKLPSTRELARRFGIHPNTVSAAYRELVEASVVEFRKGSGVFIRERSNDGDPPNNIEGLLAAFISAASASGFSRSEIKSAMDRWSNGADTKKITIVESDPGLRSIIAEEISQELDVSAFCITLEEFFNGKYDKTATIAALYDEKEKMHPALDSGQAAVFIEANSVSHAMIGSERPDKTNLIAVVSGWEQFIEFARVYLIAAKIDPEALIIRSTSDTDWRSGLDAAQIVICDSFTAKHFHDDPRVRIFRLISDESMKNLKHALT